MSHQVCMINGYPRLARVYTADLILSPSHTYTVTCKENSVEIDGDTRTTIWSCLVKDYRDNCWRFALFLPDGEQPTLPIILQEWGRAIAQLSAGNWTHLMGDVDPAFYVVEYTQEA